MKKLREIMISRLKNLESKNPYDIYIEGCRYRRYHEKYILVECVSDTGMMTTLHGDMIKVNYTDFTGRDDTEEGEGLVSMYNQNELIATIQLKI